MIDGTHSKTSPNQDAGPRGGQGTPSRWLRAANRVIVALLRLGVPIGPMQVLTVAGRRTGRRRSTPVSPVTVHGARYIVQAFPRAAWVRNVRAAGNATLGRRSRGRVRLLELTPEQRVTVLRELPRVAPQATGIFVRNGIVEAPTPEGFAAAATRCVVFQIVEAGR